MLLCAMTPGAYLLHEGGGGSSAAVDALPSPRPQLPFHAQHEPQPAGSFPSPARGSDASQTLQLPASMRAPVSSGAINGAASPRPPSLASPVTVPRPGFSLTSSPATTPLAGPSGSRRSFLCAQSVPLLLPRGGSDGASSLADAYDDGCELDVLTDNTAHVASGMVVPTARTAAAGGATVEATSNSGLPSPVGRRIGFLSLGPEAPGADSPPAASSGGGGSSAGGASIGLRPRNPLQLPSAPSPGASRSLRGGAAVLAAAANAAATVTISNGNGASPSSLAAPSSPFLILPTAAGQGPSGAAASIKPSKSNGLLLEDLDTEGVLRDGGNADSFIEEALGGLEPPPPKLRQQDAPRALLPTQRSSGLAWGSADAGVPSQGSARHRAGSDTPAAPSPRDSYSLRGGAAAASGSPRLSGGGNGAASSASGQVLQLASPVAGPSASVGFLPRSFSKRVEDIPSAPSPTQAHSLRGGGSTTGSTPGSPAPTAGRSSVNASSGSRLRQQLQQLHQDPEQQQRWSGTGAAETWNDEDVSCVQQLDGADAEHPAGTQQPSPLPCYSDGASPVGGCSSPRPPNLAPARSAFGGGTGDTGPMSPASPLGRSSGRASGATGAKPAGGRRLDDVPTAPNPRYARSLGVTLAPGDAGGGAAAATATTAAATGTASPGLQREPSGLWAASPGGLGGGSSSGGWGSPHVTSPGGGALTTGAALTPTASSRSFARRLEEIPAAPSPAHSRSLAVAAAAAAAGGGVGGGLVTRSGGSLGFGGLGGGGPNSPLASARLFLGPTQPLASSVSVSGVPPVACASFTSPTAAAMSSLISLRPECPSPLASALSSSGPLTLSPSAPLAPVSPRYVASPPIGGSPGGGGRTRSSALISGGGAGSGAGVPASMGASFGSGMGGAGSMGAIGGAGAGLRHSPSGGVEVSGMLRHQGSGGLTRRLSGLGPGHAAQLPQAARGGSGGGLPGADVLEEEDL